ncbi:MAG: hypothetical protein ACK5BN_16680 [Planctomycetota bacterium]
MHTVRTAALLAAAAFFAPLVAQDATEPAPTKQAPGAIAPAPVSRPESPKVDAATRPQPGFPIPAGGNAWFPATNKDLGTYFGTGEAVGTFAFKNPNNTPVDWKQLTGSCQCAKAIVRVGGRTYELSSKPTPNQLTRVTKVAGQPDQVERVQQIAIEAGAEGEVEVHLDMNAITGPKQASLDIHTSDPALPHMKLNFNATGAQLFVVAPSEVQLNKMAWSDSREFTVTVTSPLHKDWSILRMDEVKGFAAKWEKSAADGKTTWTIRGTYGPVDSDSQGGGTLVFHTDVQNGSTFTVRVAAFIQGPLEVKPGAFLAYGLVRKGTSSKKEVVFEPNDDVDLQATALTFEKLSVPAAGVVARTRKDGKKLIVEVEIADNAPTGMLKGELVVGLNHPSVKDKRIMFNGFVR